MSTATKMKQLPVLVIEDEHSVMLFLRSALERSGYNVVSAPNGAEGLRLLERGAYVGVVSDMRTPGGVTGADVHAWITANRPELANRILFITGDTVNPETASILQRTGVPYIEKPFRVADLIAAVEKVLGGRP